MPEKYRRPRHHERVQSVEGMQRTWEAERDALATVRRFNARLSAKGFSWFWPTIGAALTAEHPWLMIACDSCGGLVDLDLRVKPRDPEASIRVALRDVRCPRCNGHGRPRIMGLGCILRSRASASDFCSEPRVSWVREEKRLGNEVRGWPRGCRVHLEVSMNGMIVMAIGLKQDGHRHSSDYPLAQ
jgi:hypothetical protein